MMPYAIPFPFTLLHSVNYGFPCHSPTPNTAWGWGQKKLLFEVLLIWMTKRRPANTLIIESISTHLLAPEIKRQKMRVQNKWNLYSWPIKKKGEHVCNFQFFVLFNATNRKEKASIQRNKHKLIKIVLFVLNRSINLQVNYHIKAYKRHLFSFCFPLSIPCSL